MKKLVILLAAFMVFQCAALACANTLTGTQARVCNCEEFVTLRAEPSRSAEALARIPLGGEVTILSEGENGFTYVSFGGEAGYVLAEYLDIAVSLGGLSITSSLGDAERYNINLFLSNFTEAELGLMSGGVFAADNGYDAEMVRFAIEHIWFNQQDKLEWGEYAGDSNIRMSDEYVDAVTMKYFGITPEERGSSVYGDNSDGYYYWQETGGHESGGFAVATLVCDLGGGQYDVWFSIRGTGEDWAEDLCYLRDEDAGQWRQSGFGYARISASDLGDRSAFLLIKYVFSR